MPSGSSSGRRLARIAWDAVKEYLKESGDKTAQFQSRDLSLMGVAGYKSSGLKRLKEKGFIKNVENDGLIGNSYNIYSISDRIMGLPLEEILSLSYNGMTRKFPQT